MRNTYVCRNITAFPLESVSKYLKYIENQFHVLIQITVVILLYYLYRGSLNVSIVFDEVSGAGQEASSGISPGAE